jgi:hypothetical protein
MPVLFRRGRIRNIPPTLAVDPDVRLLGVTQTPQHEPPVTTATLFARSWSRFSLSRRQNGMVALTSL